MVHHYTGGTVEAQRAQAAGDHRGHFSNGCLLGKPWAKGQAQTRNKETARLQEDTSSL